MYRAMAACTIQCRMESAPNVWRFELFGGLRARRGAIEIDRFQTRKTEALIAFLALRPGQPQDREALVELLWPDAAPDAGRNRLSQAVVWLRPLLEPAGTPRGGVLVADRQSVAFHPAAVTSDVAEFDEALARADKAAPAGEDPERRAQLLRAAVERYRGPLLPRLDDEWVRTLRQSLLDRYLQALHQLVLLEEAAGRLESAQAYARRAQTADPLAEEPYLNLIRLLAASGQTSAARRQYREMERLFADTLGEEPSPAARTLFDSLSSRESEPPVPVSPIASAIPVSPSLPAPLTRFFGRAEDIARLRAFLIAPDIRLVTLVGVGGAGKTRLAIETARAVTGVPVWFLPLADLGDARQIPDALMDLMRLPRSVGVTPLDQAVAALGASGQPVLLILDNLEHLQSDAPALVRTLLERVPGLTILATSRQRLGLEGEQEWPVLPLPVPTDTDALPENDSVRLFLDRARSVHPGFALTPQNAGAIARLCERLEGLPLALELCAAWAQTLTPAQMLQQLAQRFDLLVSRRADIPARHRSLRAAVENSYLLLPPDTQQIFVRLSVFRGGWTLDAAAAVCLDEETPSHTLLALRYITELRERSLVVAEEEPDTLDADAAVPAMRYRMLETLREFAAQQRTIAIDLKVRQRHAACFLELAEAAERDIHGPLQHRALRRLETELENLRAALAWCVGERAVAMGLRLASALESFWETRGYLAEGQEWLEKLLALADSASDGDAAQGAVLARAWNALARLARARASFQTTQMAAEEALRLWTEQKDRRGMAQALLILASVAYTYEEYGRARAMQEEALGLARESEDPLLVAGALLGLGNVAMEEREWDRAWSLYEEALALYRRLGSLGLVAGTLNNMGLIARYRGDYGVARTLLEEDLEMGRAAASRSSLAVTLLNLGTVLRLQGEYGAAREALREAVSLAREVDNGRALAWCIKECGHLACASGFYPEGVRLLAASESQRRALGMSFKPADPDALDTDRARARAALGDAFDALWAEGNALNREEACAQAMNVPISGDKP